ncbi:hypothetical protein F4553_007734 [Allocatelliglobosispora scoriae]|uniref:HEAT repeat domain-containing protein n=1 Tax=Allocatelliglobosispora scoriae TaxID=643052 RepID=A0A841C5S9_9ACTN|nr:hypothetical protein [Allocatelliglobosispora scoriae]MBB5874300.1 hypothetical protein [Allocatelliglobosispora scoriae]
MSRTAPSRHGATGPPERLPSGFAEAVDAAERRGWDEVARLAEVLAEIERGADIDAARSALTLLVGTPKAVARLDENARRRLWWSPRSRPAIDAVMSHLNSSAIGPIGLALASTHADGRVRETAVARIVAAPVAELMPFLLLRTTDWVQQVRDRARAGLALLLADDLAAMLPAALGMALLIDGRLRGGFARTQLTAALTTAPVALRQRLAASPDREQRRLVFDTGLAQRWWRIEQLLAFAESDADIRIRSRAAEAACREAVWTRRTATLQRLARSAHSEVRVQALTGLSRAGYDDQVSPYLDDESALVRAVARDAVRRAGGDALAHYRRAVAQEVPALGAVAGLAETGSSGDAASIELLLAHPDAELRAQAVLGLLQLDAVPAGKVIALLRDPSADVVRVAGAVLRRRNVAVPAALLWELLGDGRAELRLAGYRFLRAGTGATQLRAALILAADADPRLAGRGRADATRLARDVAVRDQRRPSPRALTVTAGELADLEEVIARAAESLGAETTAVLLSLRGTR